ncbi:hypothetical protein P3530_24265, partial [Vibrio parahaemolyticus]|nr:hypothetical protein [Vibrio parahaemolyticus]
PVYVVRLFIISNLPFSAGVRVEAYNWERYVDNFYYHIPSALFCAEDVYFLGVYSNDTHLFIFHIL